MEKIEQFITNLCETNKKTGLSCNQLLFLYGVNFNIYDVDLPAEELLSLMQGGYFKKNRLTDKGLSLINNENPKPLFDFENSGYPKINSSSGGVIKELSGKFLKQGISEKEIININKYVDNPLMVPFIHLFLQLFPTANTEKNQVWNKHFGTEWDNVTLRKLSKGSVRKFKSVWKNKDIGLFLLGTYLFIKESFNQKSNQYFIKNIENYFKEYEHWYEMAEEFVNSNKTVAETSKIKIKSNTSIL